MNPMRATIAIIAMAAVGLAVNLVSGSYPSINIALKELVQGAVVRIFLRVPDVSTRALEKRAEQGDREAQCKLGFMYAKGEGVPQDYREAVRWLRLAAEQGDAMAQGQLGRMYAEGEGVPKDLILAYMWCNLALRYNEVFHSQLTGDTMQKIRNFIDETSHRERDELEKLMTREQIAEAQRLAREFTQKRSGSQ